MTDSSRPKLARCRGACDSTEASEVGRCWRLALLHDDVPELTKSLLHRARDADTRAVDGLLDAHAEVDVEPANISGLAAAGARTERSWALTRSSQGAAHAAARSPNVVAGCGHSRPSSNSGRGDC